MLNISNRKHRFFNNPVQTICLSFFAIIIFGSMLLFLPISTSTGEMPSYLDCLFTATSTTCITGLTIADTYGYWSTFGKCVILCLVQVGGLGLVTFSSVFALSINKKLGLKNMKLATAQININDFSEIQSLFVNIIKVTFICESIGALILCVPFCTKFGFYGIAMSVFTSICAYCNAGFDINGFLYPYCSMVPFRDDPIIIIVVGLLIILGGLGFAVVNELFKMRKMNKKIRLLSFHSKLVLVSSIALILIGTITILITEWSNTLEGMSFFEKLGISAFSSITTRTAGFNVIDHGQTSIFTKLFTCLLMFIGACPGGTGGGIKITTAIVLFMTIICVVKRREDTIIFGRRVAKNTVYKSISLIFIASTLIIFSTTVMWFFESCINLIDLLFTTISAFSNTGLYTTEIAPLSCVSKIILIILMYIGRVGPLSFALMFGSKLDSKNHVSLPEGKIYVG